MADIDNSKIAAQVQQTSRIGLFQRLAARFGFVVKNGGKKSADYTLIQKPTASQLDAKSSAEELSLIDKMVKSGHMSSSVQELFEEWMKDTQSTYANIEERGERLNALTHMCDNEGLVEASVRLTSNEVAALSDTCAFTCISEDQDWQDETNELLDKVWNFDAPTIYSLAHDIFLYGEAFQGTEVNSAGIVKFDLLKVNEVVERLEFKPAEVANFLAQMQAGAGQSSGFSINIMRPSNSSFSDTNLNFNWNRSQTYKSKDDLLKEYLENLSDTASNEFFTNHLLGYRFQGDIMVAPWQIVHYRWNAGASEFYPYGQPPLLSCLSAYKQLQRALGLNDLKKMLSLPITMYKVKTGGTGVARAFDLVNTVKERFENVGLMSISSGMEGPSLCTNIWTSDDLVTIEKTASDNGDSSAAVDEEKFFLDRLALATCVPKNYIDPSSEGFQMSGVALTALFQPFRQLVETIRNIIIAEVEDRIRLHYSMQNKECPDFVLTMNVMNPVATEDMSSRLQLADSIMDAVASLLGVDDKAALPQTVKKDVLSKYANINYTELEKYIRTLEDEGPVEEVATTQEEVDEGFGDFAASGELGDEMGGGEDMGSADEAMGESVKYIKLKKKRLLEKRYRAIDAKDMKYYLTECLGKLQTATSTNHYCSKYNSKLNEEYGTFIKQRASKNMKHGKHKMQG